MLENIPPAIRESRRRKMLAGLLDRGLGELYVANFDQFEINRGRAYPHLVFRMRGNHEYRPFFNSFLDGDESRLSNKNFILGTQLTGELFAKAEPYLILRKSQAEIVRGFRSRRLSQGEFYGTQDEYIALLKADEADALRLDKSRVEAAVQLPEVLDEYYTVGLLAGRNYRTSQRGRRIFEPILGNKQLADKFSEDFGGSVMELERSEGPAFKWTAHEGAFANFVSKFELELRYARAAGFPMSPSFVSLLETNERTFKATVEDRMGRLLPIVEEFSLLDLQATGDFTRVRLDDEVRYEHKADTLAEFLKLYRKDTDTPSEPLETDELKNRFSQREVAHRAYMNLHQYGDLERDHMRPVTFRSLMRLSVAMGMSEQESAAFAWAYYVPISQWERVRGGQRIGPVRLRD